MDDVAIDQQAEQIVRSLARAITDPRGSECLVCYVARMLDEFGCDNTLRFAVAYRDLLAPRATALEGRLAGMGGFCDCEIFLNGMWLAPHLRTCGADGGEVALDRLPACAGVRRGSTRGCAHWVRRRRDVFGEW